MAGGSYSFWQDSIYADKGCGGECVKSLECPYPVCIEDGRTLDNADRDAKIVELREDGVSVADIANMFRIGERTVSRIASDYKKGRL